MRGQCADAIPQLEDLSRGGSIPYQAALARAYGRCGRKDDALALVARITAQEKEQYVNPYEIAAVYAGMRDLDKTFEWLNRAYDEHVTRLAYLNVEPMFSDLHADSRFADLARRVGLPPR